MNVRWDHYRGPFCLIVRERSFLVNKYRSGSQNTLFFFFSVLLVVKDDGDPPLRTLVLDLDPTRSVLGPSSSYLTVTPPFAYVL